MKFSTNILLGLLIGILDSLAWYLLARFKGFYSIDVYVYRNYLNFFLLLIGVILSIYFFKKKNQGFIEFKTAIKTGLVFTFMFVIVIAIFNYVYYAFITPDTIDYFLSEAKKSMMEQHVKPDQIPIYLNGVRRNFSSFRLIPSVLFWGLVSSLLAGAFMQKKNTIPFAEN